MNADLSSPSPSTGWRAVYHAIEVSKSTDSGVCLTRLTPSRDINAQARVCAPTLTMVVAKGETGETGGGGGE